MSVVLAVMGTDNQLYLRVCTVFFPVRFPTLIVPHTEEANLDTKQSMSKLVHQFFATLACMA